MLLIIFLHILLAVAHSDITAPRFDNNACKNLMDYRFKYFSKNCYNNPNVMSSTPQMIKQNGYDVRSYRVTTPDGFILTLFRVFSNKIRRENEYQPVFLQHGESTDSSVWVDIGSRSLAFRLVDLGYDVWLGNLRSTRYTDRAMNRLNATNQWNYTFDTLAANDLLPSLIKVGLITGRNDVIYVGHSTGTTLVFMVASDFDEMKHFLKGIIALSPIAYLDPRDSPSDSLNHLVLLLRMVKDTDSVSHDSELFAQTLQKYCSFFPRTCREAIDKIFGRTTQFLPEDLLTFYSYWPSTTSVATNTQLRQWYRSGKFQKFDFGTALNKIKYQQEVPPVYNLSKIEVPTFLYYGRRVSIITERSVGKIYNEIGSATKQMKKVPVGTNHKKYDFNHIDFIYSKYLEKFLYRELFEVMVKNLGPTRSRKRRC